MKVEDKIWKIDREMCRDLEFSSSLLCCTHLSFPSSTLTSFLSEYINILAQTKNTHGLNKVRSDFRVWDLQINPAWVSWGPGSGINCYISWPSSCCLSQPAWLGPGLAGNHGLQAQQCGHFPHRKNTGLRGLLSKQDEPCQHSSLPHFTNTFSVAIFSSLLLLIHGTLRRYQTVLGRDRNVRKGWPMLRFSVRKPVYADGYTYNSKLFISKCSTGYNIRKLWLIFILW